MISTVIMLIATQFPGPDPPIPAPARAQMFVLSQVRCYTTPGTGLTRVGSTGAACPAPGTRPAAFPAHCGETQSVGAILDNSNVTKRKFTQCYPYLKNI